MSQQTPENPLSAHKIGLRTSQLRLEFEQAQYTMTVNQLAILARAEFDFDFSLKTALRLARAELRASNIGHDIAALNGLPTDNLQQHITSLRQIINGADNNDYGGLTRYVQALGESILPTTEVSNDQLGIFTEIANKYFTMSMLLACGKSQ